MKRNVNKAARLLLLYLLRENGILHSDANQADIARLLDVNRSTITKDLRALDAALAIYDELIAQQPWLLREFSTQQAAEVLGLPERIIRDMAGAGVIRSVKRGRAGRHHIPAAEIERWRSILAGVDHE